MTFLYPFAVTASSVISNAFALCSLQPGSPLHPHCSLCNLTTIQGHCLAGDALNDALNWLTLLRFESKKASGTIDLSDQYINMIYNQIFSLKSKFPPPQCDVSSSPGYPAAAFDPLASGPLAEVLVQSSAPQFCLPKMKISPSEVVGQFLLGYCEAHSLLQEVCEALCLYLLSEVSPVKIKDGNLVANATLEAALENMSLQETSDGYMYIAGGVTEPTTN